MTERYRGYLPRKSLVQTTTQRIVLYFFRLEEGIEMGCGCQRCYQWVDLRYQVGEEGENVHLWSTWNTFHRWRAWIGRWVLFHWDEVIQTNWNTLFDKGGRGHLQGFWVVERGSASKTWQVWWRRFTSCAPTVLWNNSVWSQPGPSEGTTRICSTVRYIICTLKKQVTGLF